jgi:Glycosyl hydrolase family 99
MIKKLSLAILMTLAVSVFAENDHRTVFLYYYVWYGNPDYNGEWMHWDENGRHPPVDISSAYFPLLGPYSSSDPWVIDRHMRWISEAGVDVIVYSWWGKGDLTDDLIPRVLDSAADYGLKVSFMIEPYPDRTVHSICNDIEYLNRKYGNHPAFFRMLKTTPYSSNPTQRGVVFIYQPEYPAADLQRLSDNIHAANYDSILLLQSTDADLLDSTHADGIFTYEAFQYVMHFYQGILKSVADKNGIFIPCVSPGFTINRGTNQKSIPFRGRKLGETYDKWWKTTLAANPEFVAIISFNEWHEGTQIEPAVREPQYPERYYSYDRSYGKTGVEAQTSYLNRTERWIEVFRQLQP